MRSHQVDAQKWWQSPAGDPPDDSVTKKRDVNPWTGYRRDPCFCHSTSNIPQQSNWLSS